jgi:hypothetical protein
MSRRRAFTLLDLMITVTIMAVMASLLVPMMRDNTMLRVISASRILQGDLEVAQAMTIAKPSDPVIIKLFPTAGKYHLARMSDPDTPIERPGVPGGYMVIFGNSRAEMATGVKMSLTDLPTMIVQFNGQGGLDDFSVTPRIKVYLGSKWIELKITPTTGHVSQTSSN